MHKTTKATSISKEVKEKVWERDEQKCIICGSYNASPNAHYIARSQLGLGIEENIVTLCNNCHFNYDHTDQRKEYKKAIANYLKNKYPKWDEKKLIFRRYNV